jgi:hypothetical protein
MQADPPAPTTPSADQAIDPTLPVQEVAETLRPAAIKRPKIREIGGPKGLEPTRYGDWERAGRCVDF